MIPLNEVSRELATLLTPALPYLIGMGKQIGEDLSEKAVAKFGTDAWQWMISLWGRLWPHLEAKESTKETVEMAASDPEDPDAFDMLRLQLKKLLANDEALLTSTREYLESGKENGVVVTGSHNTVQLGKYAVNIEEARNFAIGDNAQASGEIDR